MIKVYNDLELLIQQKMYFFSSRHQFDWISCSFVGSCSGTFCSFHIPSTNIFECQIREYRSNQLCRSTASETFLELNHDFPTFVSCREKSSFRGGGGGVLPSST